MYVSEHLQWKLELKKTQNIQNFEKLYLKNYLT